MRSVRHSTARQASVSLHRAVGGAASRQRLSLYQSRPGYQLQLSLVCCSTSTHAASTPVVTVSWRYRRRSREPKTLGAFGRGSQRSLPGAWLPLRIKQQAAAKAQDSQNGQPLLNPHLIQGLSREKTWRREGRCGFSSAARKAGQDRRTTLKNSIWLRSTVVSSGTLLR